MSKNKAYVSIKKGLLNDLKQYASNYAIGCATQVRDILTLEAFSSIEKFYDDYTPKSYKRHFYNFYENSFEKFYKNPHNSLIRGGVRLSYELMDDLYKADTNFVFNLVYLGYHGRIENLGKNITGPERMEPYPYEIILDKRDWLLENLNTLEEDALKRANNATYNYLHK